VRKKVKTPGSCFYNTRHIQKRSFYNNNEHTKRFQTYAHCTFRNVKFLSYISQKHFPGLHCAAN